MLGMTLRLDLVIPQGATFEYIFELTGGPASIDGFTAQMQIRPSKDSSEIYADWSSPDEITIDVVNKQIVIKVPDEMTSALDFTAGLYDLELRGNGDVWRVAQGVARLDWEVTR